MSSSTTYLSVPRETRSAWSPTVPCHVGARSCGEGNAGGRSVDFVNNCGFGTPVLSPAPSARRLSGPSANFIGFLDQGSCGSATNSNCTSLEIKLESDNVSIRILPTPFSVPVSFVFSRGCSSSGQCLNQTCPRRVLECRARDASILVTFCPSLSLFPPPSTTPPSAPTTSPASPSLSPAFTSASFRSSRLASLLTSRATNPNQLLGAELGGALGGAAFLLLVFIAAVCIRRRSSRETARIPPPQVPFVVNPTWVLASPNSPDGAAHSHLSLPDRARPRTLPVAHQMSMPNLATQYRMRVLRPRASTVGAGGPLARTETGESEPAVGPTRSESSVWRPRIDILGARPQRAEQSFWAE
ncbi:hypothetical protein DFH09DRAFT_1136417 [Mycena vulgaris]|nr:hypothetical protein DFH09DRAFT_1136417 [Mycena vulgaris]